MSEPRTSLLLFPILSWFHRGFYDDVARRRRGLGWLPLIATALLVSIVPTAQLAWGYTQFVASDEASAFLAEFPPVSIRDGRVSSPVPQPWERSWEDPDSGDVFVAVIDTTGQVTTLPAGDGPAVLVTETEVWLRRPGRGTEIRPLNGVDELDLDGEVIRGWLGVIGWVFFPSMFLVLTVWTVLVRLGIALVVGSALAQLGRSYAPDMTWAGGVRLAVVGMVPPMILFMVLEAVGLTDGYWLVFWLGTLLLSLAWWALGVSAVGLTDESGPPAPSQGDDSLVYDEFSPPR